MIYILILICKLPEVESFNDILLMGIEVLLRLAPVDDFK
jgi:hypothetical protein